MYVRKDGELMIDKDKLTTQLAEAEVPFVNEYREEGYFIEARTTVIKFNSPFNNVEVKSNIYVFHFNRKGEFVSYKEKESE